MNPSLVEVASVPAENTAEMKISDSDSEKKQADNPNDQLNAPWAGDGSDILQFRLSRLSSCALPLSNLSFVAGLKPFSEDALLSHDLGSIHFENFDSSSSLLRQNSLLLAELKKKNSFSRNSSSNLQFAPPFYIFSRNPSLEGSSFLLPQRLPSDSYRLDYPENIDSFLSIFKPSLAAMRPGDFSPPLSPSAPIPAVIYSLQRRRFPTISAPIRSASIPRK